MAEGHLDLLALTPGLGWDLSGLYTTSTIAIDAAAIPEPTPPRSSSRPSGCSLPRVGADNEQTGQASAH